MKQNDDIFYHHWRISFASVLVDWSMRMLHSISYSKFSKFIGKHVPSRLWCVFLILMVDLSLQVIPCVYLHARETEGHYC